MKRGIFTIFVLMVCFGTMAVFSDCGGNDLPPDDGTLDTFSIYGEYLAEYSRLTFLTDHEIRLDISEEFAEKSGLPTGRSKGTYVFLFRNEEWRYDHAETLRITVNGIDYTFQNAVGTTNGKTLAFYLPEGSMISFDKIEE